MDKPKTKVYVVNMNDGDYSDCERFGEPIYLSTGVIDLRRLSNIEKAFSNILRSATEDDYLLLSGAHIVSAIAVKIWMDYLPSCKTLHWHRKQYFQYDLHSIHSEG